METLEFEVKNKVGWIRMMRPAKHNPFDAELRANLMHVLDNVRSDPEIRVLVLTSSPGAFCAGGNLQVLHENVDSGPTYWQQRITQGLRFIHDMLNIGKPVIAAVDGPALGAGFALALTADIVLATLRARFSMAYLRLGLVPDLGALYLLPRAVGLQRAKELMFSTRDVGAEEAKQLGLVMEVHEGDQFEERVREIAESLTVAAPAALALTKAALNSSLDSDRQTMFSMEASSQAAAFSASEPRIAIEALVAKKSPPFSGFPRPAGELI
ncbi:enoyl-CoA hydratase/isomerase family protein [Trinickia symbiotica]|uniref:Enoyl-CoA hydratase/isomerase family protein n=1 Tax=Trinickia symbiotica TaxID=863227 RepID=A0A2T3XYY4_9BURK|nr:enoyl-CoA hydratase/isomerase family protein [Trinickia symbiotica]PTB21727.1 enoyl-CoA hydratase/isomerase family protein [Trinickia symbiotica]